MEKVILSCLMAAFIFCGCVPNHYATGKTYYDEGKKEKALKYFEELDKSSPMSGAFWLCKLYSENGDYSKAIPECELAVRYCKPFHPTEYKDINELVRDSLGDKKKQEWVNLLVNAYKNTGQKGRAIETQKNYLAINNPNDSNGFVTLSLLYCENKQYDEAITSAKRAIELEPNNAVAYNNLGFAYGEGKKYDEAIESLTKAIAFVPNEPVFRNNMGNFLFDKGDYSKAVEAFNKAVELKPSNADYLLNLTHSYLCMGRYDEAIASVNKAIELRTIVGIGVRFIIKGGYPVINYLEEAGPAKKAGVEVGDVIKEIDGKSTEEWDIKKVVQQTRGNQGTLVALKIERKDSKKPVEKLITRETFIGKSAASCFGLRSYIYIQKNKGNKEDSLRDADKAYALDPADDWARLSFGWALIERGKYEESLDLLASVKDRALARLYEATAYSKQGKMKESMNVYFSIPEEEISPKNIPLRSERMAFLQTLKPYVKEHRDKAKAFESNGQLKEALTELSKALKAADETEGQEIQETVFRVARKNPLLSEMPEDARKHALRGEALMEEGNFEQAAAEFKKAIRIAPYTARLYYTSALINAELKKYPEAIQYMSIYLKAAPDAPDARASKDEIYKWELMAEKKK